jgi:hypothetical protein
MAEQIKISMNVDKDEWEDLKSFAKKHNMTMTQFVQRALGTEKFLREETEDEGADLLLVKGDEKTKVVFR